MADKLNAPTQRTDVGQRMTAAEDRLRGRLVRGQAGDAAAYRVFLKELSAHLRAFLRRRLSGLPDEVEDLVQETLLAVHHQRHTYDAGQPLTAWLQAIARYKLVDLLRRRARSDAFNDPLDDAIEVLAIWHVSGILIPAVFGAGVGPRTLRW